MNDIKTISKWFKLSETDTKTAILHAGNKARIKILDIKDTGYTIPGGLISEIEDQKYKLDAMVYPLSNPGKSISIDSTPSVYFLYKGGDLVYIGKAVSLIGRIHAHRKNKDFDGITYEFVPGNAIDIIEGINIFYYKPIYNRAVWNDYEYFCKVLSMCDLEKIAEDA